MQKITITISEVSAKPGYHLEPDILSTAPSTQPNSVVWRVVKLNPFTMICRWLLNWLQHGSHQYEGRLRDSDIDTYRIGNIADCREEKEQPGLGVTKALNESALFVNDHAHIFEVSHGTHCSFLKCLFSTPA